METKKSKIRRIEKAKETAKARNIMVEIAKNQDGITYVESNGEGLIKLKTNLAGRRTLEYDIEIDPKNEVINLYFDRAHRLAMEIMKECRKTESLNGTRENIRINSLPAYL